MKENTKELKSRLLAILKKEALKKGKFTLSSGKESTYYLDGRIITLTPEGAYLVGNIMLNMIKGKRIEAVGGPTMGADPIVGAIGVLSHMRGVPLTTFIVRKSAKEHGMQRQIEGPALKRNIRVILVDDVATTGKSLVEAKEALNKLGVKVSEVMVIVDRGEGAKENLAKARCKLRSIFTIRDLGV